MANQELQIQSPGGCYPDMLHMGRASSRRDMVLEHIEKHALELDETGYMQIANAALERGMSTLQRGMYYLLHGELKYRVVFDGQFTNGENLQEIVRSVVRVKRIPTQVMAMNDTQRSSQKRWLTWPR